MTLDKLELAKDLENKINWLKEKIDTASNVCIIKLTTRGDKNITSFFVNNNTDSNGEYEKLAASFRDNVLLLFKLELSKYEKEFDAL